MIVRKRAWEKEFTMACRPLLALAIAAILGNTGLALASEPDSGAPSSVQSSANYLDVRQFRAIDARVPGTSIRQNIFAWQITSGTWNGQSLDGLSVVLVEQISSEGQGARTFVCYVSDFATLAQRQAAFAALQSSQAVLKDMQNIRVEPAVIRIDVDGQSVVIHLGLIA